MSFDYVAVNYDDEFTRSSIGRRQRDNVWAYLDAYFSSIEGTKILELNCGTGEDALYLAHRGATVYATDLSTKMVEIVKAKTLMVDLEHQIFPSVLDINKIDESTLNNITPQIIFSNFGGLNCLSQSELLVFLNKLNLSKVKHLIFVIMPRFTMFDLIYRVFKRELNLFKKRTTGQSVVWVGHDKIRTYYYNASHILRPLTHYKKQKKLNIGFLPSYFNPIKDKYPFLFRILTGVSKVLLGLPIHHSISDHYLLHLVRK